MKNLLIILFIALLIFSGIKIYRHYTYLQIGVQFREIAPIHGKFPVYYKGIIIGRTKGSKHSPNLEHTIVNLILFHKGIKVPKNTSVLLKKERINNRDRAFLEFIYPKNPSKEMIKQGSILEGVACVDTNTFISNQNPNELEDIKENIVYSTKNLNDSLAELNRLLINMNKMLKQNESNIYQTTKNIELMTRKIEKSLDENQLNSVFSSLSSTTVNFSQLTEETNDTIASTVDEVEGISKNVNAITCGIRKTLRKKGGGLRLLFGQVIDECNEE